MPFPVALIVAVAAAAGFAAVFGFFCVRSTHIYFADADAGVRARYVVRLFASNGTRSPAGSRDYRTCPTPTSLSSVVAAAGSLVGSIITSARDGRDGGVFLSTAARCPIAVWPGADCNSRVSRARRVRSMTCVCIRSPRSQSPAVLPGSRRRCSASSIAACFPNSAYWSRSAEVLIIAILGGIGSFSGYRPRGRQR